MNDTFLLALLDKFSTSSVAELELQDGTTHLILRKERTMPGSRIEGQSKIPAAQTVPALTIPGETITSPMVATFYASPGPDAPPFVSPGSQVKAGDTLCILEAMKMMNRLEADFDCEVLAVHAGSGDLVEYGQILFEVKRISRAA
ncbi:MAG: acetyl-CoA carboxylase biotin carboxyl carrier protein [Treponema sp.]|jgi:acetyl-CoA carboxylase biotin carboxyl carrier protein|nr:acetyl-CoA carboxylase biotin carboxyl carrier protein [Treponema sp.]